MRDRGVYTTLADDSAHTSAPQGPGVYAALSARADPGRYCPRQRPGVVEESIEEDGQSTIVLRSPDGRYARLTAVEAELWWAMDGSQSCTDLAMLAFTRHRELVLVTSFVQELRESGFLADPHVGVYAALRAREEGRGVEGWGRRLARALRSHELAIGGVDELAGALHRAGGWALFTWPFVALLALLALAGAGAFIAVGSGALRSYSLIDVDQVGLSLAALWAALLVSFALHELAHAVAVKHFGRRVLRGGLMLYYGMPAAFVDTSDIWLAGRRPRIIVSLAGPLCDLCIGSLAALAAAQLPQGAAGAGAYRLAAASYLAALCNLNPLLELDGYYILSDWLRLPGLRPRALAFIGGPLWQKLATRGALSREERIFTLYGLLAAAYTVAAVALALLFWQRQLAQVIGGLWARGDLIGRLAASVMALAVVLPVGLGLIVAAWGAVRAAAAWVARRGYGRSPVVVAAALALLALALAALPLLYGVTLETRLIVPALWLVALAAQLALHADYRGASVARALDAFLAVTVIEVVAQMGLLLLPERLLLWTALENIGFALLLFAGFVALLDIDLRRAPPGELAGSAVLMLVAFLAGAAAIAVIEPARGGLPFGALVLLATPVYASALALALLLPLIASLYDSRLLWSWLLLWLGITAQAGAYLLELREGPGLTPPALALLVLAAGIWAAAWCAHVVALRQAAPLDLRWPLAGATGEAERLQQAFSHTYAGLYRLLAAYAGSRRARALDDRMDVLAATANWEITLDGDAARIGAELAARPLDQQGGRYAEVLRYVVAEIEHLAGATFARRAIQSAYDALPWPEREAADRRCFSDTPWARDLSKAFGDARAARLRLLRQVDRFAACDDAELAALAAALQPRRVGAGSLIDGGAQAGLWVIEAGEVAVKEGGRVVAELHRGASFGCGLPDVSPPPGGASPPRRHWASVDSDLLLLEGDVLRGLMEGDAPRVAEGGALAAIVGDLERAPFFRDLPRETLRALARQAERISLPARTPVIRQGLPSGRIYMIMAGEATVEREEPDPVTGVGQRRTLARLGPVELFGELELLRGTAPMASVVARTRVELLALPHSAVAGLLSAGDGVGRGLERLGSARLIEPRPGGGPG